MKKNTASAIILLGILSVTFFSTALIVSSQNNVENYNKGNGFNDIEPINPNCNSLVINKCP